MISLPFWLPGFLLKDPVKNRHETNDFKVSLGYDRIASTRYEYLADHDAIKEKIKRTQDDRLGALAS